MKAAIIRPFFQKQKKKGSNWPQGEGEGMRTNDLSFMRRGSQPIELPWRVN